jgi:hypothetical protein
MMPLATYLRDAYPAPPTFHYTPPPMMVQPQRFDFRDLDQVPDKDVDDKKADGDFNGIRRKIIIENRGVEDKE